MELTPREAQQWLKAASLNVRDARRRIRNAPRVTDRMRETLQAHIRLRRKARQVVNTLTRGETT